MSLVGLEMSYERVLSFKKRDREVSGQTITPILAAIRGQGSPGRNKEEEKRRKKMKKRKRERKKMVVE